MAAETNREQAQALIARAWEEMVRAGTPAVVFVRGAAGSGKSALLDACTADLSALRVQAQAIEADDTASLARRLVAGLLGTYRGVAAGTGGSGCASFQLGTPDLAAVEAALARVAPDLGADDLACAVIGLLATGREPPGLLDLGPGHRKRLAGRSLAALTLARARQEPLFLCLDDLQWADDTSAECLQTLYRALAATPAPVLLVAALRPGVRMLPAAPGVRTLEAALAAPADPQRRQPEGRWADQEVPEGLTVHPDLAPAVAAKLLAHEGDAAGAASRFLEAAERSLSFGAPREALRHLDAARHWAAQASGPPGFARRAAALEATATAALAPPPEAEAAAADLEVASAREAVREAEESGDRPRLVRSLEGLALAQGRAGQGQEARASYERGVDLADRIGDLPALASLASGLAGLAARGCDTSLARRWFETAASACRELPDRRAEGRALLAMARAMQGLGALEASEADYLEAILVLEETGQEESLAAAYRELAGLEMSLERHREAVELLRRSSALSTRAGRDDLVGGDLRLLAEAYAGQDRLDDAITWASRSAEKLRAGSPLELGRTSALLARLLAESGRLEEAQQAAREARWLLQEAGAADELARFSPLADMLLAGRR